METKKLIKLSDIHYVIVDDSEIKEGNCLRYVNGIPYIMKYDKGIEHQQYNITHSTIPLEAEYYIDLSYVEEFLYGYNIKQKACDFAANKDLGFGHGYPSSAADLLKKGFINGFKTHKELVKDMFILSEEQIKTIMLHGYKLHAAGGTEIDRKQLEKVVIKSLLPKTEWNITIDKQHKIKL